MDEQTKVKNDLPAPDFTLPDLNGDSHALRDFLGRITILNFWSAECPWSKRADQEILEIMQEWGDSVLYLPIASNVNENLAMITGEARKRGLAVLLQDKDHRVADLYGAVTTPHLFVIDADGILRYQGAFDDITFRQRTPTKNYLQMAVEALLHGEQPHPPQVQSYGCIIVRNLP
jgi:thiol-disulfide isomerase/thioredoxin